jgi:hypothetical protein
LADADGDRQGAASLATADTILNIKKILSSELIVLGDFKAFYSGEPPGIFACFPGVAHFPSFEQIFQYRGGSKRNGSSYSSYFRNLNLPNPPLRSKAKEYAKRKEQRLPLRNVKCC